MLDRSSKPARVVFYVVLLATFLGLLYFYFLHRGPLYYVAVRLADIGLNSFYLAMVLTLLPFIVAEAWIIFMIDRLLFSKKMEAALHKPIDGP